MLPPLHNASACAARPRQRRIARPILVCWAMGGVYNSLLCRSVAGGAISACNTAGTTDICLAMSGQHQPGIDSCRLLCAVVSSAAAEAGALTCQRVPGAQHPVGVQHALQLPE